LRPGPQIKRNPLSKTVCKVSTKYIDLFWFLLKQKAYLSNADIGRRKLNKLANKPKTIAIFLKFTKSRIYPKSILRMEETNWEIVKAIVM
jgi:hypothetical protein